MTFYSELYAKLKLNDLPRSYYILGKILLIKLKPGLMRYRKKIGKAILELRPYIHSVVLEKDIRGKTRKPRVEVIAGCKDTETIHNEHGCRFALDVAKVMWSKGNKFEKQRIVGLVKPDETVIDMFAGIGYFTIFLAKKARKVYAIDLNPDAIHYLTRNVWLNKVEDKVEVLEGDCRDFAPILYDTADRIVMGYLFDTEKFLPAALKMLKKNGVIHFHRNVKEGENIEDKINRLGLKIISKKIVKSYSPKVWHMVYDLKKA